MFEKTPGYTIWNLTGVILSLIWRNPSFLSVVFCSSVGVVVSFHIGLCMDATALHRLIKKNNLPEGWMFHIYNTLAHVVPVFVLLGYLLYHSVHVSFVHGLWASVLHLGWGIIVTNGSLVLDHVYASMHPLLWYIMWVTAIVTEVVIVPSLL
eukprot:gene4125-60_t